MTDRRPVIQKYLDQIEPGWVIVKPAGPGYVDALCVFQKPDTYKEAKANLPVRWFDDDEQHQIEQAIRWALRSAVVKK